MSKLENETLAKLKEFCKNNDVKVKYYRNVNGDVTTFDSDKDTASVEVPEMEIELKDEPVKNEAPVEKSVVDSVKDIIGKFDAQTVDNFANSLADSIIDRVEPYTYDYSDAFYEILDEMRSVYKKKNSDYGSATNDLFKEYGLTYYLIMLEQKLMRLKSLAKSDVHNFESVEDSLLDLANYAVLGLKSLREDDKK